jgi:hypothetical protein
MAGANEMMDFASKMHNYKLSKDGENHKLEFYCKASDKWMSVDGKSLEETFNNATLLVKAAEEKITRFEQLKFELEKFNKGPLKFEITDQIEMECCPPICSTEGRLTMGEITIEDGVSSFNEMDLKLKLYELMYERIFTNPAANT